MPKLFFPSSKPVFINRQKIIDEFRQIALQAADKYKNIVEIYLFGSYARGNAGFHSDADILIILSSEKRNLIDRLDEFILTFSEGPVPVDVLAYTRVELKQALKEGNCFLAKAVKGIKLFKKGQNPGTPA
jgi:predicted nucleotidyltransferase